MVFLLFFIRVLTCCQWKKTLLQYFSSDAKQCLNCKEKNLKPYFPLWQIFIFWKLVKSGVNAEGSGCLYTICIQSFYNSYNWVRQYGQVSNPSVIEWSVIHGPWHSGTLFVWTSGFPSIFGDVKGTPCSHTDLEKIRGCLGFRSRLGGPRGA